MSMQQATGSNNAIRLVDIRPTDKQTATPMKAVSQGQVECPPSPPASTESAHALHGADMAESLYVSLEQPFGEKSIPTHVLYDQHGLQLFDQITLLDDYYLTAAERGILLRYADKLAERVQPHSAVIELGAGALRKTKVILDAIERRKCPVTYYALDLDRRELERTLGSLGSYKYVSLCGLLGSYDDGMVWIRESFVNAGVSQHKVILWLGSSIGNMDHYAAAKWLRHLQHTCLQPGDLCVIGFDGRNPADAVLRAYNDRQGITEEFIMNGLDHANAIMGCPVLSRPDFVYDSRYQDTVGRHIAHYRAIRETVLAWKKDPGSVRKDELIHVEYSFKYTMQDIVRMLTASELDISECWQDAQGMYRLVVADCRPFTFACDKLGIRHMLERKESIPLGCSVCDKGPEMAMEQDKAAKPNDDGSDMTRLCHVLGNPSWPKAVPTMYEWHQLWNAWDLVTQTVLTPGELLDRPIELRHPFVFYLGHIPGFMDIQLTRHRVDEEVNPSTALTEPLQFSVLFERGIDPDMEDPSICNPHSKVPTHDEDWPHPDVIRDYQSRVRLRLETLLFHWQKQADLSEDVWQSGKMLRHARVTWMCFEHEAMHLETLLYMLMQSPNRHPPAHVAKPAWDKVAASLNPAPWISFSGATVTLGHDDDERQDHTGQLLNGFGWDNERPARKQTVGTFKIQSRPVTNAEYLAYLTETGSSAWPASWECAEGKPAVRTLFGPCPMSHAGDWPVAVSCNEAEDFARHFGWRLPTEAEWHRLRDSQHDAKIPNVGFRYWHPTSVDNQQTHVIGDLWEWTSTDWEAHDGFVSSELYPGYSSDFFDGKHRVILGGSWATHPRISERRSFRNWYQKGYPYVFSGFRCVTFAEEK